MSKQSGSMNLLLMNRNPIDHSHTALAINRSFRRSHLAKLTGFLAEPKLSLSFSAELSIGLIICHYSALIACNQDEHPIILM